MFFWYLKCMNYKNKEKGFAIFFIFILVIIVATLLVVGYVFVYKNTTNSDSTNTTNTPTYSSQIDNSCFRITLPDGSDSSIELFDTSTDSSCKFIAQYEGRGDTPIAVGEVFTGSYSDQEKIDFIPEGLKIGYELDLLDLGLLRTGKGSLMNIIESRNYTVNGQNAVFITHESNRSISSQAYSAAIVAPEAISVNGEPASALFVWGAANKENEDYMEKIVKSVEWK